MIKFANGPAAGQVMHLRRAPVFLRVTYAGRGKFDALDLLTDEPHEKETLYVYRRKQKPILVHLKGTRKVTGFYLMCEYELEPVQPTDAIMRDKTAWQQWTRERARVKRSEATPNVTLVPKLRLGNALLKSSALFPYCA